VGISPNSDIEDLYYPYVGYADHVHRISLGIFADGRMSWLRDGWKISQNYVQDSLVGITEARSDELQLKVASTDLIHYAFDILWRNIVLENQYKTNRNVRLFAYHDLHIDENPNGDTAMLDPHLRAIIHYKNDFYFGFSSSPTFDQFATGRKEWQGLEGTWRDADDGRLSGNAVSNGPVDSCIGWDLGDMQPGESRTVQLFMTAGRHFRDISRLHTYALNHEFNEAFKQTTKYWQNWVTNGQNGDLPISENVRHVYSRSLLILRSMCSENGAIIASSDSDIERVGGDTYDYVWPRDASWCALALAQCGYHEITRRTFNFILNVITKKGYLLHKYYPTGSFGSTWHPVPFIQIDQSGVLLHALWNFYLTTGDIEFVSQHRRQILNLSTFLAEWRDEHKLPRPSWDLWEEREATTTYSAAAVYAGLHAGSNLARLIGLDDYASDFDGSANEVREGILEYLYDPELGRFLRSINPRDESLDASLLVINEFGVLPPQDSRIAKTVDLVEEKLWVNTNIGGLARYAGDAYLRVSPNLIGNPWILTTLYLSMFRADAGELKKAHRLLEWATARATSTRLLPEQVNAYDGSPIGVLPLAWSHAAFILAVKKLISRSAAERVD